MASNSKKSGKDNETGDEEDLWFDAARKLGKDQDDVPDYSFKDDNRRTFAIVGSIFAIFLFGGILWYLYYQKNLGADGEVPLIAADHEPVKTRPADPGGMEVPYQDRLIFDRVSGQETELQEKIQPTPEQPLDDLREGRGIADLIAETEPGKETTAMNQPPAAGLYIIQLGAFGQQTGAENAWAILEQRYRNTLGSLSPNIQPITSSSGQTLYRLRAGYFATREEAERVCANLKKLGQDCLATTR